MAISATVIDAMVAAGCSAEQLAAVIKADIAEQEAKRESKRENNAERQQRWRDRRVSRKSNGSNALRSVTPPIDNIHTPGSPSSAEADDAPPSVERVISHWNEVAARSGMKPARALNADRRSKLCRRLSEFSEETLIDGINRLAASPFHCGEGSRGWKADIGWFVKSAENVTKALELDAPKPTSSNAASPLVKSILAKQPTKYEAEATA
jgi:hypothetical protein